MGGGRAPLAPSYGPVCVPPFPSHKFVILSSNLLCQKPSFQREMTLIIFESDFFSQNPHCLIIKLIIRYGRKISHTILTGSQSNSSEFSSIFVYCRIHVHICDIGNRLGKFLLYDNCKFLELLQECHICVIKLYK